MLKWAVGGGDQPPGGAEGGRIADTPTTRRGLGYRQSLRKTAERFHLLPSTEAQQPIKRAVIRNLNKNKQEGKENADEMEEAPQEKRPRDRSLSLLRRIKALGHVTEKSTNGRPTSSHVTDKPANGRGPLGDVTNQSPIPSPRNGPKVTPARSRSRVRRTLSRGKMAVEQENKSETTKSKCTSCNTTPRRKLPKRTPKRKKQMPEYNVSPLKPSDLCIDYSPDLGDSLLALRRRLEESFPTQHDNPLYYTLKPNIQDNPMYMSVNPSVSPLSQKLSWLKLGSPTQSKITPPTPFISKDLKNHDITDPRFLEMSLKNIQLQNDFKKKSNFLETLENTEFSMSPKTSLQSTVKSSEVKITTETIIKRTRLRRNSDSTLIKTEPINIEINRRRRYSDTIRKSQNTQIMLQTLLKHELSPIKSDSHDITIENEEEISEIQTSESNNSDNTEKNSESSMEICNILSDNNNGLPDFIKPLPVISENVNNQNINTLPTPRLTPDLLATCCGARYSVSTYSEVSTLGETWDSHRLHTILMQQSKVMMNRLPTMQDIDTPPILETKSLLDTTLTNDYKSINETPLSDNFELKIKNAKILDLARPKQIDILTVIDSVLHPNKIIKPITTQVNKKLALHCETPNIGASFSQDPMTSDVRSPDERSTEVTDSPLPLVDRTSRSRRCLLYASPSTRSQAGMTPCRNKKKRKAKSSAPNRGEVKLALYNNSGLLTIHVISATNLPQRDQTRPASAFVKICVLPRSQAGPGEVHRTNVRRPAPGPGGSPLYRFDQKFSLEVNKDEDLTEARVLVSVWLRPRAEKHRKSECVGCMSFGVQDVLNNEVRGTFLVLSPSSGRTQNVTTRSSGLLAGPSKAPVMADHSDSSVDETRDTETPRKHDRRRSSHRKSYTTPSATTEDSTFLRHLELEPTPESGAASSAPGRTPFTTTRKLDRKPGTGFGFSVAWTQPPRVERVEAGLPADKAGLRPGDYVIFVESHNVVTMPEEEILSLIRLSGNHLTLEVYRRSTPNGVVLQQTSTGSPAPQPPPAQRRSASVTDCSATTSLDLRRRLQLPQVAFTSEAGMSADEARRRALYQLLQRLQNFALAMHFGVERFLLPLTDRKDLLTSTDHLTLFQNIEELVMLTEELLEQLMSDDPEHMGACLGRIYFNKIQALTGAYRKYCLGLKRADCLLAQKTSSPEFLRVTSEPPIPKRRPDLTTFIHKPLEHYRETLKLLQTVLKHSKVYDEEYSALSKVVQALQTTYRDITANSGLMEPDGEGRPLLSLQDLESRLVFTKCKPFVLNTGGRQWIFGGDLSRVDGRSLRPFWALLFTDLLLLAKVSRDRVLFVTDEPLSLLEVTQACFSVKKKETEFRLILDGPPHSPAEIPGGKPIKNKNRRRSVAFRAPTPELKAVWQNLLQRQIIYLNTVRGGTPNASPLDSPAEQPSLATMDSPSRLQLGVAGSQRHLDQLIEQKCRLLGKSGLHKGSALHLQQWMTGQLGAGHANSPVSPDEPEPEIWSPGTLRRRGEQLASGGPQGRSESRLEDIDLSSPDPERSPSRSTDDSQITVKSGFAVYKKGGEQQTTPEQAKATTSTLIATSSTIVATSSTIVTTSSTVVTTTSAIVEKTSSDTVQSKPPPSPVASVSATEPKSDVVSSTVQSSSPAVTSSTTTAAPVPAVAMCKDCLEKCAHQPCPSSHRRQSPTVDSSDYDSEEGDQWEPLPSELGISMQRDPFFPQDDQLNKLPTIAVVPPTPSDTRSITGDSVSENQRTFEWDSAAELVAAAEACAMSDEEEDDLERTSLDGEPPYRALLSSQLRKYGTLSSLENVAGLTSQDTFEEDTTEDEQPTTKAEDSDQEDIPEDARSAWFSAAHSTQSTKSESGTTASSSSECGTLVHIDAMQQSLKGWAPTSGASVAEKTKMFEQISEQYKGNHVSIERFLPNPIASGIPPIGVFNIPRTISSSCFVPGNDQPTPPKTPTPPTSPTPKPLPRVKKILKNTNNEPTMPRTVALLSKEHHTPLIPTPATVKQPIARHTVVMGTTATLKSKAPAVPVRSKIYSSFKTKAPAPPPPIPTKPLELPVKARPSSPILSISPNLSTSAAAAAAIAAANQVGSPDTSVSDKDEWGTPEGGDPEDTEEELSSTQDIVSLFPCVGVSTDGGQGAWSDEDEQLSVLLSAPPRVFPRRRLEPVYEEEDEGVRTRNRLPLLSESSASSGGSTPEGPTQGRVVRVPPVPRRGCMVPGQGSWADVCADNEGMNPSPSQGSNQQQVIQLTGQAKRLMKDAADTRGQTQGVSSGLLQRFKLASSRRRGWGGVEQAPKPLRQPQPSKLLGGLLGNNRSEDNNGNPRGGALMRLFGNNNNNNANAVANTTAPSTTTTNTTVVNNKEGSTARPDQDKILDRRFWKQLKRRRGSLNSSNPPIAV